MDAQDLRAPLRTVASSFLAGESMSDPDAEILFVDDVIDAMEAARWCGLDDETLIRLLREIAAELREGGSTS